MFSKFIQGAQKIKGPHLQSLKNTLKDLLDQKLVESKRQAG